jgi:sialate O-acetylesterase
MVLQRGMKVPVWGTADAGEKVTVKVGAQSQSATAGADGRWRVTLDPLEGSKQPVEVTIVEKNTLTFKDVLIGEVWVCSGQSNMGFSLKNATGAKEVIAAADRPTLRMFMVGRAIKDTPQDDLSEGEWVVCTPQSVPGFSAVAYFFLTELQKKVDAPMGLIQPSWGGTPDASASRMFNAMIAPLAPFAIKGAIWYQGESNADRANEARRTEQGSECDAGESFHGVG